MDDDNSKRIEKVLRKEILQQKEVIDKLKEESNSLKKAIWDMLNYANIYILLLDKNLIIRLINNNLAKDLGYENEKTAIGHCWMEHIPASSMTLIRIAHKELIKGENSSQYKEVTNDIRLGNGQTVSTKWFNVAINSVYNMTFSIGIKLMIPEDYLKISEESIRSYYKDIIEKDRSMIKSLREVAIKNCEEDDDLNLHECIIELRDEEEEN
jgi:hypothetical protein